MESFAEKCIENREAYLSKFAEFQSSGRGFESQLHRIRTSERKGWRVAVELLRAALLWSVSARSGRGVSVKLTTREEVRLAFGRAKKYSELVAVEEYISGADHCMLVIDGELVAVAKRIPATLSAMAFARSSD